VLLDGEDVTHLRADQIAARGLALVPGGAATFPSLTVAEHVRLAAWTQRNHPEQVRVATDRALGHFPVLRDRLDDAAGTLSGGQQQMLALAMALIAAPRLLLIDELSLGLAPVVVRRIYETLPELLASGVTVLLVEQDVSQALRVASRVHCLLEGRTTLQGAPGELTPERIESAYFGLAGLDGGASWPAEAAP
jgi:branched-chain amino acid transport system ATP-binding protein